MLNNKGAMFGLDARIALAIFGALSVISGAALYSAIQDAKATSTLTEMQEVIKAWEQYILDTGLDMPVDAGNPNARHRDMSSLIEDPSINNWKGPYLPHLISPINPARLYLKSVNGLVSLTSVSTLDWGLGHTYPTWAYANVLCNSASIPCLTAVQFSDSGAGELDFSLAKSIDNKIDSDDGPSSGNFRWYTSGSYKIMVLIGPPHKSPL